jgi:chaperonin GroES
MIQAFGERILVQIVEKEKKQGVLIVPDDKNEFQIGKVTSIGPDLPLVESNEGGFLETGNFVYTRKYAGLLIEYEGVEYVSIDHKEILAFSKEMK